MCTQVKFRIVVLLLLAVLPLEGGKRRAVGHPSGEERLLFVGNSQTYFNGLPSTVCALARRTNKTVTCTQVAFPDYALSDHLEQGDAVAQIGTSRFTTVILQQGPSALESSRVELLASAHAFNDIIRAAGAKPAFYAVWPSRDRPGDFARSAESYRLAAEATGGLLFPVGATWAKVLERDPAMPLYNPDGLHASRAGSYLAALVIYRVLYNDLPASFADAATAQDLGITAAQLRTLWGAAAEPPLV